MEGLLQTLSCPVCLDLLALAQVTHCGHVFCLTCLHECSSSTVSSGCPTCRAELNNTVMYRNYALDEVVAHLAAATGQTEAHAARVRRARAFYDEVHRDPCCDDIVHALKSDDVAVRCMALRALKEEVVADRLSGASIDNTLGEAIVASCTAPSFVEAHCAFRVLSDLCRDGNPAVIAPKLGAWGAARAVVHALCRRTDDVPASSCLRVIKTMVCCFLSMENGPFEGLLTREDADTMFQRCPEALAELCLQSGRSDAVLFDMYASGRVEQLLVRVSTLPVARALAGSLEMHTQSHLLYSYELSSDTLVRLLDTPGANAHSFSALGALSSMASFPAAALTDAFSKQLLRTANVLGAGNNNGALALAFGDMVISIVSTGCTLSDEVLRFLAFWSMLTTDMQLRTVLNEALSVCVSSGGSSCALAVSSAFGSDARMLAFCESVGTYHLLCEVLTCRPLPLTVLSVVRRVCELPTFATYDRIRLVDVLSTDETCKLSMKHAGMPAKMKRSIAAASGDAECAELAHYANTVLSRFH